VAKLHVMSAKDFANQVFNEDAAAGTLNYITRALTALLDRRFTGLVEIEFKDGRLIILVPTEGLTFEMNNRDNRHNA